MKKIAILGNPNTGKSSVFNLMTGLNQKVGNFTGVTVELKSGKINGAPDYQIIDFPGVYSLFPNSGEEQIVMDVLSNSEHDAHPNAIITVVDSSNLERNLLLFDQIYELNIPNILVLNMADVSSRAGLKTDLDKLSAAYPDMQIIEMNARVGLGKKRLLEAIKSISFESKTKTVFPFRADAEEQNTDTLNRRNKIESLVEACQTREKDNRDRFILDKGFAHPVLGYGIFILVLFIIFQSVFALASYPMDWIDMGFSWITEALHNNLPPGVLTELLSDGILPGIGGVLIFIPQIALLFFFLGVLEETGYLSRVIFLMDRLMRPLGLNGRSVVPLISSLACAIPGIMAARTIANWKERLITIFVAPLMSCSARIPVYTVLIAIVIPDKEVLGFINLQGLVLLGLYLLGLVSALLMAVVMKMFIKSKDKSFLLLELPPYKGPRWGNVIVTMWAKTRSFVFDAGKIILTISILIWFTASYGPKGHVSALEAEAFGTTVENEGELAALRLENSYIGIMGQTIEPVLRPLGYDWKIGIGLIASFAAREVFVGTMATIYSVHDSDENSKTLLDKMRSQTFKSGQPVYTLATGVSLMVFYVYALQCMATVAVVKKETNSWKWPILQLVSMGVIAYLAAWITYQILS
ncbi:ferrous iron transport protein B [Crocinitomicaceae bacterium]|nr:ferrous iron transport protein B [Crocinitomicaceae bacterium]